MHEFRYRKIVEFSETDLAGVVHFSNFFRYMEMTEHAFFRAAGIPVYSENPKGFSGWPKVHVECNYKKPLRFADQLEVYLQVVRKSNEALTYHFIFYKITSRASEIVADGRMTVVYIVTDSERQFSRAHPIPQKMAQKITVAPSVSEQNF